jgi:hypothetical protein
MSEVDAHIQDAEILKMSKQETNDAGNRIRFLATLPSGREIHSEWLDPGQRREAMKAWLAAVRAEIVRDEEEVHLKAKRARMEAMADGSESLDSAPPAEQASNAPIHRVVPSTTAGRSLPSVSTVMSDPALFIKQAVAQAEQNVSYWRAEATKATAEWQAAEAALKKWRGIATSIGVSTSEELTSRPDGNDPAGGVRPGSSAESPEQAI